LILHRPFRENAAGAPAAGAVRSPQGISMTALRNLVLVHQPGRQDRADFETIASKVHDLTDDIEAFVASNEIRSSFTRKKAAERPTLVFSPGQLDAFQPLRGKIYAGQPIPKLEQMARMAAAGLPVPAFAEITPDLVLSERAFGSHVVVKPGYSLASRGQDITLMRREMVRYRSPDQFAADHPGRYGPMFVQRFIDTGPLVSHYRVLTLFGKPLFAYRNSSLVARAPLDASDDVLAKTAVKARRRANAKSELIEEADVLALAGRTYAALREIPLHGVDIVREHGSGTLFVLEVNPGGNTWVFSKGESTARLQRALGVDRLTDQFDALTTAAKVLIERTRAEAE
jgi:hypothetical protein